MGIRIPVRDHAPSVAFEDVVQLVFDALGDVPEFRDPKGKQIGLKGTLALAVTAGHTTYREVEVTSRVKELRRGEVAKETETVTCAAWQTGHAAFVMFVLLSISLNLLRTATALCGDETPMTLRSPAAEHTISVAPETLIQKPP
jgi:hypothetical protein